MASRSAACPSNETCWVCGQTPSVKNRGALKSPVNKRILVGLQRLGVSEEQLPSTLREGSVVQRVYICKGCFSEVENFIKLQADVESAAGSIRSKLRAEGLSIDDSGHSISGQVFPITSWFARDSMRTKTPDPHGRSGAVRLITRYCAV